MSMRNKGRMIYVPHNVLDEADMIMQSKEIKQRSDALREMAKYSKVGREAEQILKLDFGLFKKKGRSF